MDIHIRYLWKSCYKVLWLNYYQVVQELCVQKANIQNIDTKFSKIFKFCNNSQTDFTMNFDVIHNT